MKRKTNLKRINIKEAEMYEKWERKYGEKYKKRIAIENGTYDFRTETIYPSTNSLMEDKKMHSIGNNTYYSIIDTICYGGDSEGKVVKSGEEYFYVKNNELTNFMNDNNKNKSVDIEITEGIYYSKVLDKPKKNKKQKLRNIRTNKELLAKLSSVKSTASDIDSYKLDDWYSYISDWQYNFGNIDEAFVYLSNIGNNSENISALILVAKTWKFILCDDRRALKKMYKAESLAIIEEDYLICAKAWENIFNNFKESARIYLFIKKNFVVKKNPNIIKEKNDPQTYEFDRNLEKEIVDDEEYW